VIDLNLFQRGGDFRNNTSGRLQGTGGVRAFPAAGDGRWMQFSDAAGNSTSRRGRQSLLRAGADDVAVNHRQGKLLPLQIAFADQPADHHFHRWRQPAASAAAARSARNRSVTLPVPRLYRSIST
jgi:hypothetical protein